MSYIDIWENVLKKRKKQAKRLQKSRERDVRSLGNGGSNIEMLKSDCILIYFKCRAIRFIDELNVKFERGGSSMNLSFDI